MYKKIFDREIFRKCSFCQTRHVALINLLQQGHESINNQVICRVGGGNYVFSPKNSVDNFYVVYKLTNCYAVPNYMMYTETFNFCGHQHINLYRILYYK